MAAPWGLGTGSFKQFCSLHVPSTWKVVSAARSTKQPRNLEKRMESVVPSSGSCTCHFGSRPISWRLVTWPHLAAREAGTSCWVGGSGPRSSSKSSVTKERKVLWTLRTANNLHHGPPLGPPGFNAPSAFRTLRTLSPFAGAQPECPFQAPCPDVSRICGRCKVPS